MSTPPSSSASRGSAGWSRSRIVFLAVSAAVLAALLFSVAEVLLPFILALIIAYVLTPLVQLCERVRIPRALSIVIVYVITFSLIYGSVAGMAPRIYAETAKLVRDTPALAKGLATRWGPQLERWLTLFAQQQAHPRAREEPKRPAVEILKREDGSYGVELGSGFELIRESPEHWRVAPEAPPPAGFKVSELAKEGVDRFMTYVSRNVFDLIKLGQALVAKLARGIFMLFMTLMVAGYIMHTRESIMAFFRTLPPPTARPGFDRLLWRMDRGLSGVVRGQLLICLVNGLLSAAGFWLFGLKYWPIMALIAAIMSIIPIFGSILSTIPAVLIGLTQDFWTALWVLLWVIVIHQVEANLLNPKIIGVAAKIHPVLVVFALIVGEHFFGLWGALLAVPTFSVTQSVFNHFRFESMPDVTPDSVLPAEVQRRTASGERATGEEVTGEDGSEVAPNRSSE